MFSTLVTSSITEPFSTLGALDPVSTFSNGVGIATGLVDGILNNDWQKLSNTAEIFLGQFYTDGNRSIVAESWQGVSRYTREYAQTTAGYNYSQLRSSGGNVDRVELWGGATFSINEEEVSGSVSLGNFINADIRGKFTDVRGELTLEHEYGHTFDSQIYGALYLPVVGLPSIISASNSMRNTATGLTSHETSWTEVRANKHIAKYLEKYY